MSRNQQRAVAARLRRLDPPKPKEWWAPDEAIHDRLGLPRKKPYWGRMYATVPRVCDTCQGPIAKGDVIWVSRGANKSIHCLLHRPQDPRLTTGRG